MESFEELRNRYVDVVENEVTSPKAQKVPRRSDAVCVLSSFPHRLSLSLFNPCAAAVNTTNLENTKNSDWIWKLVSTKPLTWLYH
jgi:hypothetical protein